MSLMFQILMSCLDSGWFRKHIKECSDINHIGFHDSWDWPQAVDFLHATAASCRSCLTSSPLASGQHIKGHRLSKNTQAVTRTDQHRKSWETLWISALKPTCERNDLGVSKATDLHSVVPFPLFSTLCIALWRSAEPSFHSSVEVFRISERRSFGSPWPAETNRTKHVKPQPWRGSCHHAWWEPIVTFQLVVAPTPLWLLMRTCDLIMSHSSFNDTSDWRRVILSHLSFCGHYEPSLASGQVWSSWINPGMHKSGEWESHIEVQSSSVWASQFDVADVPCDISHSWGIPYHIELRKEPWCELDSEDSQVGQWSHRRP